jgi:DNA gyrase subunit B
VAFTEGGVGLSVGGSVALASVISQGCTPIGETWTITRVDKNLIHSIGNRPAYEVLANQEVQAIISALGTGVHEEFTLDKLRYHKIVLMADADVDGHHINTLLLTLLFRFMKPLIENGFVYMAQPPLYRLRWNKPAEHEFVYSDSERDLLMRDGLAQGKKLPKENPVQRYKGLGEMNAEELWETTMDPSQRLMLQVSIEDAAQADEMFSVLMGEDVEQRRSFIQRNAKDVRFLDI